MLVFLHANPPKRNMKRMAVNPEAPTRIQRYRAAMRARGMRPVQIWLPDTRTKHFELEARRQCEAANAADSQDDTMDWIESISVFDEA